MYYQSKGDIHDNIVYHLHITSTYHLSPEVWIQSRP